MPFGSHSYRGPQRAVHRLSGFADDHVGVVVALKTLGIDW
jgi:hypothetical protein